MQLGAIPGGAIVVRSRTADHPDELGRKPHAVSNRGASQFERNVIMTERKIEPLCEPF